MKPYKLPGYKDPDVDHIVSIKIDKPGQKYVKFDEQAKSLEFTELTM